jgi:uncharacterized protein YndB with AHSA1/START domain
MNAPPLRVVRVLWASPEEVFDAWTDPKSLAIFMAPGSVKGSVVESDPRVGGRFRIVMKGADCDHEHTGEYLVLDRPRALVFTWTSKATRGKSSTVSIGIRSVGPGQTEVTLLHEGLPDEPSTSEHRSGWGDILDKLGAAVKERRGKR